jgi:hypothetical protein
MKGTRPEATRVTANPQIPAPPGAYDIVEIVDERAAARLHAVVERVENPHLVLRLERAATIPRETPVRWFDGDTAWQAVSHIETIDSMSVICQLAPPPEWELAPVRQSLRVAVDSAPILVRSIDSNAVKTGRPVHAVCVDISATGCRATWPGTPPQVGGSVEIAWEFESVDQDGELIWVPARIARIVPLPFGTRQVAFRFEPTDSKQASHVRDWHQIWLQEHRRLVAKHAHPG